MKNYNINSYSINNERGMAALLSVIILSMIMVSTLSSFYIYIENRARFQERLRMNYQTGYVMEDMGRVLAQSYDLAHATSPTACTDSDTSLIYLDCAEVCGQDTTKLPGVVPAGTPQYAVCVKSDNLNKIINGADYFCAFNADGGGAAPSYCSGLVDNDESSSEGAVVVASANAPDPNLKIENWYARLDNFFDTTIVKKAPVLANKMYPILESKIQPPTLLGWLLPETAYAGSTGGGGNGPTNDCNTNPDGASCADQCHDTQKPAFCKNIKSAITLKTIDSGCTPSSVDPRCKKCGKDQRMGTGADGTCLKISICPPWINSKECLAGSVDRRLHQMVRIN